MPKKTWMVRAGQNAYLASHFEENDLVSVEWLDLGDLSNITNKHELTVLFDQKYNYENILQRGMSLGQISRFRFEMNEGDNVITYNSEFREYSVGEIVSDYQYVDNSIDGFNHIRQVRWLGKVKRDDLSVSTKNAAGPSMTLFVLSDSAVEEIMSIVYGTPIIKEESVEDEDSELETLRKDVAERAFEFIKDSIQSLNWEQMQKLIAGILRSMGYKTRISPKGPDRGVDIVASPDGLGMEQPRIRVEVKHRTGSTGANLLRSFIGGLRQSDRGLYVSTGGFSKEARYEAERSTVPVTLIDIDEIAKLLIDYYDNTDIETKSLVPMTKLYWPK